MFFFLFIYSFNEYLPGLMHSFLGGNFFFNLN